MRKYSSYDFDLGESGELNGFIEFLDKNNVFTLIVASVLASRVSEMSDKLVSNVLMPIIERDGDGDGESDIARIEGLETRMLGCRFRYGLVLIAMFKLLFVAYVVYKCTSFIHNRQRLFKTLAW